MGLFNWNSNFTWAAQKSGPSAYPMKMLNGMLFFKGKDYGLPIPTGTSYGQWGRGFANHPETKNSLPDRLEVRFYSYAENQTYYGLFDLPYESLVEQFKWGLENQIKRNDTFYLPVFDKFVIAVAPGGAVGVWISGPEEQREVFFGYAEPVEMDLMSVFQVPFRSDEEAETFRLEVLQENVGDEQFQHIQTHGAPIGVWERYRKPYDWIIEAAKGSSITEFRATHVNGVKKPQSYSFSGIQHQAIPNFIKFYSLTTSPYTYKMFLGDYETIAAFEELDAIEGLTADEKLIHIEITPRADKAASTIRLYNAKHSIELKKVRIK